MFEADNQDIISRMLQYKTEFLTYKIIFHCRKCGSRVPTVWDGWQLEGYFTSDDATWSEVLDVPVSDPTGIVCWNCLNKFEKKIQEIRKRLC
jgi:hypothetical protein